MLYVVSAYIRKIIGIIDIDGNEEIIRISHLSFWGKKVISLEKISNIQPITDTNQMVNDIFCLVRTYDKENIWYIKVQRNYISNPDGFATIFGDVFDSINN